MIELLFQSWSAPNEDPRYRRAMADILEAEEHIQKCPECGQWLEKLTDAYARREERVALSAFQQGFRSAAELLRETFPEHREG